VRRVTAVRARVLSALLLKAAQQAPPVTLFTIAIVVGLVVGVFGHIIRSRALIMFGIVVVGGICGYVVVSSYAGAFL
jgi:uncharacterized membrane protein YhhN